MTKEERAAEASNYEHYQRQLGPSCRIGTSYYLGFLDGIAYRDQNPSDEVMKLVEAIHDNLSFWNCDADGSGAWKYLRAIEEALSQWRKAIVYSSGGTVNHEGERE